MLQEILVLFQWFSIAPKISMQHDCDMRMDIFLKLLFPKIFTASASFSVFRR